MKEPERTYSDSFPKDTSAKPPLPVAGKGAMRQRVVRGGLWMTVLRVFTRLLSVVQIFIIARLLDPADFGLFGIALIITGALQTFSETGFDAALIQKDENVEPYLDTAWVVQIARGCAVALLMIAFAGWTAVFFNEPKATLIIYAMALVPFFLGFRNIAVVYFQKDLEFSRQFSLTSIASMASVIIGIVAAFILRNVWALVIMAISNAALMVLFSYLLHPFRPRFCFHIQKAKTLFGFGKWVLGTKIMKFFILQGDTLLVGKMLGTQSLGFYKMAMRVSQMPATEVGEIIDKVTFPVYSKMQGDVARLRSAWLKTVSFVTLVTFPMAGGIFVLAPEIVSIVLGNKWASIIPLIEVLCILGALKTVGNWGAIFRAVGQPKIITIVTAWRLVLMAVMIYPLMVRYGPLGAVVAVILASVVTFPYALVKALRLLDCRISEFIRALFPSFSATFLMIIAVLSAQSAISPCTPMSFVALIIMGAVVYVTGLTLVDIGTGQRNVRSVVATLYGGMRN